VRPVIFLDIDGVLNHHGTYDVWRAARGLERGEDDAWVPGDEDPHVLKLFDAVCVGHLNALADAARADVVVSSSWRLLYSRDFERLREVLVRAGVRAPVLGPTRTSSTGRRRSRGGSSRTGGSAPRWSSSTTSRARTSTASRPGSCERACGPASPSSTSRRRST
jgi:hypothetical protein